MAITPVSFQNSGFRPNNFGGSAPGQSFGGGAPNQFGGPGDRFGASAEARGLQGGAQGAQALTQALSRDIGQVMQAQSSGDQNRGQQALQALGNTYQQGQQSGQLQQVPPMVRQTAEQLLGINQNQQGKQGGGCQGGGGCGGGGGAPEGGKEAAKSEEKSPFNDELKKALEDILGKDKAKEAKEGGDKEHDGKAGDKKGHHKKGEGKAEDKKSDGKAKVEKTKASTHKPAAKAAKPTPKK